MYEFRPPVNISNNMWMLGSGKVTVVILSIATKIKAGSLK